MSLDFSKGYFLVSGGLAILFAWAVTQRFATKRAERFWLFTVIVTLQLGAITSFLSLFYRLTPQLWLIVQLLLSIGLLLFTKRSLRSVIQLKIPKVSPRSIAPLFVLTLTVLLVLTGLTAAIQWQVPISMPLYGDERNYHASRVIYYLHQQSTLPYPTHNDRQTMFGFGAELIFLWPVMFLKSELPGRILFWLGYPLTLTGLYLLIRTFRVERKLALLATLTFAATPLVLRYATGLKPELWLTFFVLGTCYWVAKAAQTKSRPTSYLFWAGIFFASSVNVKFTSLAMLPALLVVTWSISRRYRLKNTIAFSRGALVSIVCSGLLVVLASNWVIYGHPLGQEHLRQVHSSDLSWTQLYTHAVRMPFLLFEVPAVPWSSVREILANFGNRIIHFLGADTPLPLENPDTWPGVFAFSVPANARNYSLGGIVWLAALFFWLSRFIRSSWQTWPGLRFNATASLFWLGTSLLLGILFLVRWMVHSGVPERFLIAPYAVGIVLAFVWLNQIVKRWGKFEFVVLACVVFSTWVPIKQELEQALTAIMSPVPALKLNEPFAEALSAMPEPSTILLIGSEFTTDYPLFLPEEGYANKVIPWGASPFNAQQLRELINTHKITHVLIDSRWSLPIEPEIISEWLIQQADFHEYPLSSMHLFETTAVKAKRQDILSKNLSFLEAPARAPFIFVSAPLQNQVGVTIKSDVLDIYSGPFMGDTSRANHNIYWIGGGGLVGLEGELWSQHKRLVQLQIDIVPINEEKVSLQLTGLENGVVASASQSFDQPVVLTFLAPLQQGRNPFSLSVSRRKLAFSPNNRIAAINSITITPWIQ